MPPIFGRHLPHPHPYDAAIETWLRSSPPEQAMGRNVMHDHRVTLEREQNFEKFAQFPRTAAELQAAMLGYFNNKIRSRKLPDYVYESVNGVNILVGGSERHDDIDKDVSLARVLDLNGLVRVYQWAWQQGVDIAGSLHEQEPTTDVMVAAWLNARLTGARPDATQRFIEGVLHALDAYAARYPYQPTWAATWSDFAFYLSESPDRWLEVVGVCSRGAGRWVIPLCYTIRDAGTLVRPTQLDAGWYCYHFPSPPAAPRKAGGHTMDLQSTPPQTKLISEFIHKQIEHPIEHWIDAGRLAGKTTKASAGRLDAQRNAHHDLLATVYGGNIRAWMPVCI